MRVFQNEVSHDAFQYLLPPSRYVTGPAAVRSIHVGGSVPKIWRCCEAARCLTSVFATADAPIRRAAVSAARRGVRRAGTSRKTSTTAATPRSQTTCTHPGDVHRSRCTNALGVNAL